MDDAKEGFSLVKIGIGAIVLLVVIGIVVAIMIFGSGLANEKTNELADTADNASMIQFSRYDNAEVLGSDIITAVNQYQDSNLRIYVANKGANGGTAYDPAALMAGTEQLGPVQTYCYMGENNAVAATTSLALDADSGVWKDEIIPDASTTEVFNRNTSPLSNKNSRDTYVRKGAHYWAYLVYDSNTDDHAGILFVQID